MLKHIMKELRKWRASSAIHHRMVAKGWSDSGRRRAWWLVAESQT